MKISFGDTSDSLGPLQSFSRITFFAEQLNLTWTHCSSSADFLSQFYAGVLTAAESGVDVKDVSHSIGYMANELIENAVKFRSIGDVEIEAGLGEGEFLLRIRNWISMETGRRFQELLEEITTADPGDLLIQRIEANAADGNSNASGLGLLTLMNDYGVRIAWHFEQPDGQPKDHVCLKTIARLPFVR